MFVPRALRSHLLVLISVAMLFATDSSLAQRAELMDVTLTIDEPGERPGLFVEAHYEFDIPAPLVDALHRGIALYFTYEFELYKKRWYWIDQDITKNNFNIRLTFNPLTRRYAISYSGISLSFDSLEETLPYVKNIRRWRVASSTSASKKDVTAAVRFFLDTSKLPKPMQVTNHDSDDWTIESDWSPITIPETIRSLAGK